MARVLCHADAETPSKCKLVCIHPVLPLMCLAGENGVVSLWNYADQERILHIDFPALQPHLGVRMGGGGALRNLHLGAEVEKRQQLRLEKVTALCFLDRAAVHSNCGEAQYVSNSAVMLQDAEPRDQLLIGTEAGMLLVPLEGGPWRLLMNEAGKGGYPTALLIISPQLLLIGGSDGTMRTFDFINNVAVASLPPAGGRVHGLIPTPGIRFDASGAANGLEAETTAAFVSLSDGAIGVWRFRTVRNLTQCNGAAFQLKLPPKASLQDAVVSYDAGSRMLFLSLASSLSAWELPAAGGRERRSDEPVVAIPLRTSWQLPPVGAKARFESASLIGRANDGAPIFSCICTGLKNGPLVIAACGRAGERRLAPLGRAVDLRSLSETLPQRLKLYAVGSATHRSGVFAVGCNHGAVVLQLQMHRLQLRLYHPSFGRSCLRVDGRSVCRESLERRADAREAYRVSRSLEDFHAFHVFSAAEELYHLEPPEGAPYADAGASALRDARWVTAKLSPNGRYVAVLWPGLARWQLLALSLGEAGPSQPLRKVSEGVGLHFSWVGEETYLVAGLPGAAKEPPALSVGVGAAAPAPLPRDASRTGLEAVSDGALALLTSPDGRLSRFFGLARGEGAVMRLCEPAAPGALLEGEEGAGGAALRAVGAAFKAPRLCAWSRDGAWCALIYDGVCAILERGAGESSLLAPHSRHFFHASPCETITDAMWALNALFYVSPSEIGVIVPRSAGGAPAEAEEEDAAALPGAVEHFTLAKHTTEGEDAAAVLAADCHGVPVLKRPLGTLHLLGVCGASLVLAAEDRAYFLPLTPLPLRLSILLANGLGEEAAEAVRGIDPLARAAADALLRSFGAADLAGDTVEQLAEQLSAAAV